LVPQPTAEGTGWNINNATGLKSPNGKNAVMLKFWELKAAFVTACAFSDIEKNQPCENRSVGNLAKNCYSCCFVRSSVHWRFSEVGIH